MRMQRDNEYSMLLDIQRKSLYGVDKRFSLLI